MLIKKPEFIRPKKRILIIDDDKDISLVYARFLKHTGFKILKTIISGPKGIQFFKNLKVKPDVIILDYRMPGMNGIETAKKLLDLDPSVKIIFASSTMDIIGDVIALGAIGFYYKGNPLEELVNLIENT